LLVFVIIRKTPAIPFRQTTAIDEPIASTGLSTTGNKIAMPKGNLRDLLTPENEGPAMNGYTKHCSLLSRGYTGFRPWITRINTTEMARIKRM
jgi:hypothetical protein